MDSLKRSIRFFNHDLYQTFGWFWGIMLIIDIASYILMDIYDNQYFGISNNISVSVAAANIAPIVIFFIVYVSLTYYENFPVAIGFSITRKDFFKAAILNNMLIILIFAIIQTILMKVDISLVTKLGRSPMVDFGIFNTLTDNSLYMIFSLFLVLLTLTSIMNLSISLNYKFGYKFWIVFGIIFSFTSIFIGVSYLTFIEKMFTLRIDIVQLLILVVITIVMYLLSYLVVSHTNIKNKTT